MSKSPFAGKIEELWEAYIAIYPDLDKTSEQHEIMKRTWYCACFSLLGIVSHIEQAEDLQILINEADDFVRRDVFKAASEHAQDLPTSFYENPRMALTFMQRDDALRLMKKTNGVIHAKGKIWDIQSEHVGDGIFRVTLVERE